jgi:DNA end-binding protein Ku
MAAKAAQPKNCKQRRSIMASTVWKGFLQFGLVTVPVKLSVAARSESVEFHMLHKGCNARLEQKYFCKACGKEVPRADTVKGYEEDNAYLLVEPNEIEAIAPRSSTTMEVIQFVSAAEVDPIYLDASYFLEPEKVGRQVYKLLLETMRRTESLAIAKLAMRQREHTVVIRPYGSGLALHTLFYEAEVRAQELSLSDIEVADEHLRLAEQLIQSMLKPFDPTGFADQYQAKLVELLEAKRQGKPIPAMPARAVAPVVDILAALQQSLGKKPPVQAEAAVQTSVALATKPKRRTGTR